MGLGFLKFSVHTGEDALPVPNVKITVKLPSGSVVYTTFTDENGNTEAYRLYAPDIRNTLVPDSRGAPSAMYNADLEAEGYITLHLMNIPIVDTQTTVMPEILHPLEENQTSGDEYLYITPNSLEIPLPTRQNQTEGAFAPAIAEVAENAVAIPDFITVHLGIPANASARNVRVPFVDYIKNVVSSEIYSTWPQNSIDANVNAIVTFALNRIYTRWYRNRGFNFDITNTTQYDMNYREGGPVYESISRRVDELFNIYARRIGFENPFFTQFCNGTTTTCNGLSQWGTVTLANQGLTPLQILHSFYPDDLELVASAETGGITESYPGSPMSEGMQNEYIRRMQQFLNRIRVNYPLITQISNPNGYFGTDTGEAVRTFQRTFNLTSDGIIGRNTWNKISFIFTAVTRLAELDSEGIRIGLGIQPPNTVLRMGSRGADVVELEFLLNYISLFYASVPSVIWDGVFDTRTQNSVLEFQKTFGLAADGIVGPATWNKLYSVFKGIDENVDVPVPENPGNENGGANGEPPPEFPGIPLRRGDSGIEVQRIKAFLNFINTIYPSFDMLTVNNVFDAEAENAVKIFQELWLLPVTGIIDRETWDKIVQIFMLASGDKPLSLEYSPPPLRRGSRGSRVMLIQSLLTELAADDQRLLPAVADGIFGPETERAVKRFQEVNGLAIDGIVGPVTWAKIMELSI